MKKLLETQRLLIRDYTLNDFEACHQYASDPDVSKFDFWGPNSPEDTKKFLQEVIAKRESETKRYTYEMAITLKTQPDLVIGGVGLRLKGEKSKVGDIGYVLNPKFQRQGITTEATLAIIDFGFKKLDLLVIYATCDAENIASYKVMEKCGMKKVGIFPNARSYKGKNSDQYRYEILREGVSQILSK